MHRGSRGWSFAAVLTVVVWLTLASSAGASSFTWIDGYDDPATPAQYDKVGILKEGSPWARNVLVLVPGTSASSAYFRPLAKLIAERTRGWQVWSVERRENLLEDQSKLDAVKSGDATLEEFFDYYLGWLTDPSVTDHFALLPDADVPFARDWGMRVAVEDLRRVIDEANDHGRRVVLGGHSLGGSITTAYATWDFNGRPGAKDLSGLVFVDGGSGPPSLTAEEATQRLQDLSTTSPWLTFGGIPSPFTGLFNIVGSTFAKLAPNEVGPLATWPLLPANLRPPVPATNEAGYGYALDTETSPPSLAAAQVHAGRLAAEGDPRPWDPAGELSPIQRVADMFSGTGLPGLDGTAWYHPLRLTIDSGAVGAGIANPAQAVLDVNATHGDDLRQMPIYAFAAALGGQRVLEAAQLLATQSGIPDRKVTLIDGSATYAHVDPISAYPSNEFVRQLVPFLEKTTHHGHRHHHGHGRGHGRDKHHGRDRDHDEDDD
jgi:pimeloyl-ACP methyl ester carboxylesterase